MSYGRSSNHVLEFISTYALNYSVEEVRNEFCMVTIFFTDLSYTVIRTKKAYDLLALLCDIGGALGLILGSTVLTFFEVADFCLRLLCGGSQGAQSRGVHNKKVADQWSMNKPESDDQVLY